MWLVLLLTDGPTSAAMDLHPRRSRRRLIGNRSDPKDTPPTHDPPAAMNDPPLLSDVICSRTAQTTGIVVSPFFPTTVPVSCTIGGSVRWIRSDIAPVSSTSSRSSLKIPHDRDQSWIPTRVPLPQAGTRGRASYASTSPGESHAHPGRDCEDVAGKSCKPSPRRSAGIGNRTDGHGGDGPATGRVFPFRRSIQGLSPLCVSCVRDS
jgi:hypothetical protein